jgi:hypothetical protein
MHEAVAYVVRKGFASNCGEHGHQSLRARFLERSRRGTNLDIRVRGLGVRWSSWAKEIDREMTASIDLLEASLVPRFRKTSPRFRDKGTVSTENKHCSTENAFRECSI